MNVHQTSPDADVDAAAADWQAKPRAAGESYEKCHAHAYAYVVTNGETPHDNGKASVFFVFARQGERAMPDPRGSGYGGAPVLWGLAERPDAMWHCQTVKINMLSIALAR